MANTNLFSVILFFTLDVCSQSYFISSEDHEPHLGRGKHKLDVEESKEMKGNCETRIKTCY